MNVKKVIILSLGGSLIYPETGINVNFLKAFNELIRKEVIKGTRFFIVCGGGRLSRNYQGVLREVVQKIPDEDVDWIGIHTTRMNAQLLRTIFADICYQKVIYHYDEREPNIDKPVVIAAGWKPGWSTDYCSTLLAEEYKATSIINLSNIDVVYTKDPRKFPDAKPIEKISWDNFVKLVGDKWSPGANVPFDPIATKLASKLGLSVFIVRGSNIDNLERLLDGKPFKGTIIMPFKLDDTFFNREYYEMGIGYSGYTSTLIGRHQAYWANFYRALMIKLFLNPQTLLDVGCSTGLLVRFLRILGVEAYGMETSRYALSKAHFSIGKYLKYGSILDLPYKDKTFDIVTTFNVLEHIDKKNIPKALSECYRVRKKYCLHKIYTSENKWIKKMHKDDLSQISVYSKKWWYDLFRKLGYKEVKKYFPILPEFMETIFILNK